MCMGFGHLADWYVPKVVGTTHHGAAIQLEIPSVNRVQSHEGE